MMRSFLLLVCCWLLVLTAGATTLPADTTVLSVSRLPTKGLALKASWRYHAGDNPQWAQPGFDDRGWDTLNPTLPRQELPPVLSSGISWLRLRLQLGDSLRQRDLLVNARLTGACEIYLNGRLVLRQGVLNTDPAQVQPRGRYLKPGEVPAGGPAEQVLAVRYAPWQPPLLVGLDQGPLLVVTLFNPQQFWEAQAIQKDNARVFLVLMGFSGLLAFLHLAFYYYHRAQRANRYFARFALTAAIASLFGYWSLVMPFPTLGPYLVVAFICNALVAMHGLWAIQALCALFRFKPGRFYAGLWGLYSVLIVAMVFVYGQPIVVSWVLVLVLHIAEQVRLTVRALRQRQRGAWIIATGFASGLFAALVYAGVRIFGQAPSPLLLNAIMVMGFVLPALGISLFLAREFALDSQLLQVKLGEVERLSAQTLAQEQEKQALLAQQNETLEQQVQQRTAELQHSLTELRTTQAQLIQKEKMASLGELTAGIAHEIQNPLNFVTNFSDLSVELSQELQEEARAGHPEQVAALAGELQQNLQKITHHGQRAASIVRGMLEHSRARTGERVPTDLNVLVDEYLRLAYHGRRAQDKSFNAELRTDLASGLPPVEVVTDEIGRVLLNLFGNAFYAVQQRQQQGAAGYQPTVSVATKQVDGQVEIRVQDNGMGIPAEVQAKIFQPFFTTKPTGEGTGLGLSLAYDIVTQGHRGTLSVESQEGKGTTMCLELPLSCESLPASQIS